MWIDGCVVKHQNNLNKNGSWYDTVSNHISWMYISQSQKRMKSTDIGNKKGIETPNKQWYYNT